MEKQNIEEYIHEKFKKLSYGLMQSSYSDAYDAYSKLYGVGGPIIPFLKAKILETDLSKSKYKELTRYFSGIFSLLYDLDEREALKIGEKIISDGCPQHIKAIIKSIYEFSLKNYKRYQIKGLDIFEHKFLNAKCNISYHIERWLSYVPDNDLKEISRLYIINRKKINASGTYTPVLKVIALLWDNQYTERSLSFKFFALYTEQVLYHEIGHHKNRHSFGIDADQEKEADQYAFKIMQKSHPVLVKVLRILSKLGVKSNRNYYRWRL